MMWLPSRKRDDDDDDDDADDEVFGSRRVRITHMRTCNTLLFGDSGRSCSQLQLDAMSCGPEWR